MLILTSPKAGSGASREQVPRLVELLEEGKIDCHVTHAIDDMQRELASTWRTHEAVVVAAGGDGTVTLAASALSLLNSAGDKDVPIVPMPLGTENLLAREFGHTADAEKVVQTIRRGTSYHLDMGMANGRPFLIMATCGFDAEVVRGMHLTRRGHIQRLSYLRPIFAALRKYRFPSLRVCVDGGEPIACRWAMVFNLPRYGGALSIEPHARGSDGLLDLIAFEQGSFASGLKYAFGIWFGRHLSFPDVIRQRGKRIEISSDERVPVQVDGDYAGRLPLRIEVLPGKAHLLLPPGKPADLSA